VHDCFYVDDKEVEVPAGWLPLTENADSN
jgi:hypothetical protein